MSVSSNRSWFQRLLLPPIILQSVLIGGGYATGREVVEYAGRFGSRGWFSVAVIFVGFSVMSILCFELARVSRSYDYKRWIQQLIGPLWPLFDVLLIVMTMLVIAVMVAAAGTILKETLGVPEIVGMSVTFLAVALLNYLGESVIERFKTWGTLVLYMGYVSFAWIVLDGVSATEGPVAGSDPSLSVATVLGAGVLYVGYNLAVYPVVLFSLHRQSTRSDTVLSGLLAGVMMTIPFVLTFLCILRLEAADEVIGAEVPWLVMLEGVGGGWVVGLFGVVVGWTLVETAVGGIHALVDRVDKNMGDLPGFLAKRLVTLSAMQRGVLAGLVLVLAMGLSRFGIIALVATGYGLLAYGFILLLALPLLTVGIAKIVRLGR